MHVFRKLILALSLGVSFAAVAHAQRVFWEPSGGTLGFGKSSTLALVFDDCSPTGDVVPPRVDGLQFGEPGTEQQTTIDNFQMRSRVVLRYPVNPTRKGELIIPSFDVDTSRGKLAVGEVKFNVGDANVGQSGVSIEQIVTSTIKPAHASVWAGEIIDFEYVLSASSRYNVHITGTPEWTPQGLVIDSFSQKPDQIEVVVNGERRSALRYHVRGIATKPGTLVLDPVHQAVEVQTGERSGFFFSQPRMETFTIDSSTPELTVKPLPHPAPAGFSGAVGNFTFESKIVPDTAGVGEPITWTLTLTGAGNWPSGIYMPQREISQDFQVIQPKSRQDTDAGTLFQGKLTEDAVLVPTKAGDTTIGPVSFTSFDPAAGAYHTETTDPVTVHVHVPVANSLLPPTPAPAATSPSATPPDSSTQQSTSNAASAPPPPLPHDLAPIGAVPRSPIKDSATAAVPRAVSAWWTLFVAFVPPLITWLGLAWRQARKLDVTRRRRAALREIRRLLRKLQQSRQSPDIVSLECWRAYTARAWGIDRATPTPDDVGAAVSGGKGAKRPEMWVTLWREAEAAMFSPTSAPPADWVQRALDTAQESRVRRVTPGLPVRVRHWFPTGAAMLLVSAVLIAPHARGSVDPIAAYNNGDFEQARGVWLGRLAPDPGDWAARNNVAITYAQDGDWASAAAQWTSAFLLNPHDESIRANARLALSKLDGVDPLVRRVIDGEWYDRPLAWLSPAEWEIVLVASAAAIALGLCLLVVGLYLHGSRAWTLSGKTLFFLGLASAALASAVSLRYGELSDPSAAFVTKPTDLRSIPTDLVDRQASAPLTPGTIVTVGKQFIPGWVEVTANDGATVGWIRRENVTRLYQTPYPPRAKLK